jgi:hypothetical protein
MGVIKANLQIDRFVEILREKGDCPGMQENRQYEDDEKGLDGFKSGL